MDKKEILLRIKGVYNLAKKDFDENEDDNEDSIDYVEGFFRWN